MLLLRMKNKITEKEYVYVSEGGGFKKIIDLDPDTFPELYSNLTSIQKDKSYYDDLSDNEKLFDYEISFEEAKYKTATISKIINPPKDLKGIERQECVGCDQWDGEPQKLYRCTNCWFN